MASSELRFSLKSAVASSELRFSLKSAVASSELRFSLKSAVASSQLWLHGFSFEVKAPTDVHRF